MPTGYTAAIQLALCDAVAQYAHIDQVDKGGKPYFLHCERVANALAEAGYDWRMQCAALLHDVVEDTPWTVWDLLAIGIDFQVVFMVELMTRVEPMQYPEYIRRMAFSWKTMVLKYYDMSDNLSFDRLTAITDEIKRARLQSKYEYGQHLLELYGVGRYLP